MRLSQPGKEGQIVGRFLAVKALPINHLTLSIESQTGSAPQRLRKVGLVFRHENALYKSEARLINISAGKASIFGMTLPVEIAAPLVPTVVPDDVAVWCSFQEYATVIENHLTKHENEQKFRVQTMTNEGITVKISGTKRSFMLTTGSIFKSSHLHLHDDKEPIDLHVDLEIAGFKVEEHPDLSSRSIEDTKRRDTILDLRYVSPDDQTQDDIKKLARRLGYHNFVARSSKQSPKVDAP